MTNFCGDTRLPFPDDQSMIDCLFSTMELAARRRDFNAVVFCCLLMQEIQNFEQVFPKC